MNPVSEWALSYVLRVRIWIGKKRFPAHGPRAVRVGQHTLIKFGWVERSEAEAMQFVAENTSIPVPKVHKVYQLRGSTYIVMEYVEGKSGRAWSTFSESVKKQVIADLKGYIAELRALRPMDSSAVSSVSGGPIYDHRIGGVSGNGPFSNHEDFHAFLRLNWPLHACTGELEPIQVAHGLKHTSKFTHGDLVPRNVIIRDGRVAAIIDWDCAGVYPEYWEYTKAHFAPFAPPDWIEALGEIIGLYEQESQGERMLWERFDEPGGQST
jgi:serine/threonine protein kinase